MCADGPKAKSHVYSALNMTFSSPFPRSRSLSLHVSVSPSMIPHVPSALNISRALRPEQSLFVAHYIGRAR